MAALLWNSSILMWRPADRALRWFNPGTMAIREGAYLQATRELQSAIELEPHFALAHARLAEAWANLDFTGAAEREMLLAYSPEARTRLWKPDGPAPPIPQ